jgi:cyclase
MQPHRGEAHDDVHFHRLSHRVTVALAPVMGERVLANATIVVGDRVTAVVDAMVTAEMARAVRVEAERLGGRPVGMVVLTHADADHVLGLGAFPGAIVVGARRSAEVLEAADTRRAYADIHVRMGGDAQAFDAPAVDVAYPDTARLDLGGLHLEAEFVGPAHSPADTLLWCPEERVAWSGDLVFHGVFPLVRNELWRWYEGLDRLAALRPVSVVPGHGLVAGPEVVAAQRRVLQAIEREVAPLYAAGVPVEEAVTRVRIEAYAHLPLATERLPGAVRGLYQALGTRSSAGDDARDA